MTAAWWTATYWRSSTTSPEAVFGEFTGPRAPQERYAGAPDWIAESKRHPRVGAAMLAGRS